MSMWGIMKNRIVKVSSVFHADINEFWDKLQRLDTLQFIAAPFAAFELHEKTQVKWREGETFAFRLKLFGLFSLGTHTIRVVQFDKMTYTVYTIESNKSVPVWNHRIVLRKMDENTLHYTDEVELQAGWKSILVYWWSCTFYRHRQKKWRKLLEQDV